MRRLGGLATGIMLLVACTGDLHAFKAPDESRFPVKSVGVSDAGVDESGIPAKSVGASDAALGLQTLRLENLDHAVSGDVVRGAKDFLEGRMKLEFERAVKDQQGADVSGQVRPPFTAEVRKVQTDPLGFTHVRMAQLYQGIPVVGGELIVHVNQQNVVVDVNGKVLPPVAISVEPTISAEAALQGALAEFAGVPGVVVGKQPSLVIFRSRLAYHFVIEHRGDSVGQWWHYVDAHTGELLQRYNNIKFLTAGPTPGNGSHRPVSGNRIAGEDGSLVSMTGWKEKRGSFYLYNFNQLWGVYDDGAGKWERNATNSWGTSDRAAISAGYNFARTQAWVQDVLGRDSFDGAGGFARANVHTSNAICPTAWWDHTDFHFCDSDYITMDAPSALDVVAHEYGHAITEYTSDLINNGESGALGESFSDIMAVAVEFAKQPDGSSAYPNHIPGRSDWLIGEDVMFAAEAGRDLRDPKRFGQPSYYLGKNWYGGPDDNGGVHTNCGVQNYAFYLLAEGGSGTNEGHPHCRVKSVGIGRAAQIAMHANMYYLTDASTHADAREAWIKAASHLGYGVGPVEAAWAAVGVGRYRDNGDNTVKDTCTGLIWQNSNDFRRMRWDQALGYCTGGWRLPRVDELTTIVDYSRSWPAIDPVFIVDPPDDDFNWNYWSSSTVVDGSDRLWSVQFLMGGHDWAYYNFRLVVRCVSGGPFWPFNSCGHLAPQGNETVLDTLTHLEWQQTDDGVRRSWDLACFYCDRLEHAGKDDWRLPTIQELQTIVSYTRFGPSICPVFGGELNYYYWSSTKVANRADLVWALVFWGGYTIPAYWDYASRCCVRCVRGGQ